MIPGSALVPGSAVTTNSSPTLWGGSSRTTAPWATAKLPRRRMPRRSWRWRRHEHYSKPLKSADWWLYWPIWDLYNRTCRNIIYNIIENMWLVDDKGLCCSSYSGISQSIEGIPSYDWIMPVMVSPAKIWQFHLRGSIHLQIHHSFMVSPKKLRSKQKKTNIFWQQK